MNGSPINRAGHSHHVTTVNPMKQAKIRPDLQLITNLPTLQPLQPSDKRVAVLGLSHEETRVVQHTLGVMRSRGLSYSLVTKVVAPGGATLVILDGSRPRVVSHWKALKKARPDLVGIAIVEAELERDCPAERALKRPLTAHSLIAALGELEVLRNPSPVPPHPRSADFHDAPHIVLMTPPVATPPVAGKAPRFRGRVLVIGSAATRRHLNILLTQFGLEAQSTHAATLGLKILAAGRFDAVLMEANLPDADGYQICKTVKKDSAGVPLPVIMLTDKLRPFGRVRGRLAGCDTQLVMPIGRQQLEDTLARYLPASRQGVIAVKDGKSASGKAT